MPQIKLSEYVDGRGIKTEVDGFELPEVRDITFRAPADGIATLSVEMNVQTPFVYEGSAEVHLHFVLLPGHSMVEIEPRDGHEGNRYIVTRVLPGEENTVDELLTFLGQCEMRPEQAARAAEMIARIRGLKKREQ